MSGSVGQVGLKLKKPAFKTGKRIVRQGTKFVKDNGGKLVDNIKENPVKAGIIGTATLMFTSLLVAFGYKAGVKSEQIDEQDTNEKESGKKLDIKEEDISEAA